MLNLENIGKQNLENQFKNISSENPNGLNHLIEGTIDKVNTLLVDNTRILTTEEKKMIKNIILEYADQNKDLIKLWMETKISKEDTSAEINWDITHGKMESMLIQEALRKYTEKNPNINLPNVQ
jgi:hypothetical protein